MCSAFLRRFTAPGDTVLGIGVESTSLPEVALKLGRRVELILADQSTQREVQDRIVKAYRKAVSRGRHQVNAVIHACQARSTLHAC